MTFAVQRVWIAPGRTAMMPPFSPVTGNARSHEIPLSPASSLYEFFRQLWQKLTTCSGSAPAPGEDFVLTAVNPAEEAISADFQPGTSLRSILGHSVEADELFPATSSAATRRRRSSFASNSFSRAASACSRRCSCR